MGLLDAVAGLFGGGARVGVALDAAEVLRGGVLTGKVTVSGGRGPLRVNAVGVRLLFVSVRPRAGASLPEIQTRVVADQEVARGFALGAREERVFAFGIPVAESCDPSSGGLEEALRNPGLPELSYSLRVVANIAGVKDPMAKAAVRVCEPAVEAVGALAAEG